MKIHKLIFTTSILLSSFIFTINGQNHTLDSVNVSFDSGVKLSMAVYEYKNLSVNIENDLKSLQTILKGEELHNPDLFSHILLYEPDKRLTIKPNGEEESIIWENGNPTYQVLPYQVRVQSGNYYLKIQSNNVDNLLSDSLVIRIKQVADNTYAIQNRRSKIYNYSFNGPELLLDKEPQTKIRNTDYISYTMGVGVNLIKNQPVVDLLAEIAYTRVVKGISLHQFYVSYNELYDFSGASKIHSNGFVNLGYRHNLSDIGRRPNWVGLEAGYLVARSGDMFKKHTFRFGCSWSAGKGFTISPQLYLSRKHSYPAIRFGFGL